MSAEGNPPPTYGAEAPSVEEAAVNSKVRTVGVGFVCTLARADVHLTVLGGTRLPFPALIFP